MTFVTCSCACITRYSVYIYKLTEAKMTVHIGFTKLCKTVTTDANISNQTTKVKMTVHMRFV